MGLAVVTVASGGLPIVESTVGGTPVTEAANGRGVPVTKVIGKPGLPVVFETIGVAVPFTAATLDGVNDRVVMSNGNLTATSNNWPALARSATMRTTGKYYFEETFVTSNSTSDMIGVLEDTATRDNTLSNVKCSTVLFNGNVMSNDTNPGKALGSSSNGTVISVAVDLTARLAWFRRSGGNWNGDAAANPATGTGGVAMKPAVPFSPGCAFAQFSCVTTANLGGSAFAYTVPVGFTSGWPA